MRSFLRNRRFKNFAFKTDVLCSCLLLNSNAKYEEKFTLEPSIGINFPIKIKHDYLLVFKYIDKGNIKNIRICVLCSKQKEGTEGTASWIAEGIDSVDISMTTGLCTIISKSTWLSLSVHEL